MRTSSALLLAFAFLFAGASSAGAAPHAKGGVTARKPAAQACKEDSDCGDELAFVESCRVLAPDNKICHGKQRVRLKCENGSCARFLGACDECKWEITPALPGQCANDAECSFGMPTEELCSMVQPDNHRCEGKASVAYQCSTRASGQTRCDRLIGPCNECK